MGKDCSLQYASSRKIFNDTGLITKNEAIKLFNSLLPEFSKRVNEGDDVEICIWKDMKSNTDYHKTLVHIHSNDCVFKNGTLYELKPVIPLLSEEYKG